MATAAELLAAMAVVVEAQVTGATRLGSDYRVDLEKIPAGSTRYALAGGPAGEQRNSNASRIVLGCVIGVYHHLASPTAERAYTEGAMQTTLDALVQRATWTALAEVYHIADDPTYEVERIGNVIATQIQLQLSIA